MHAERQDGANTSRMKTKGRAETERVDACSLPTMFPQCTNQRQRSLASGQKNDELHGPNVGCGQVEYIHQPSSEFSSKKSQL